MDELRILLTIIGALIIAAIYLWGIRSRIRVGIDELRRRRASRSLENEPIMSPDAGDPLARGAHEDVAPASRDPLDSMRLVDVEIGPVRRIVGERDAEDRRLAAADGVEAYDGPTRTVLMTIMAPEGHFFEGIDILEAARDLDLKLSRSGVLDCLTDTDRGGKIVFSIAHLREPGTFHLETVGDLRTPGLLLFMNLPGPSREMVSVDLMISVANQLARGLGGNLCDVERNRLDRDGLWRFRAEAARFERDCREGDEP